MGLAHPSICPYGAFATSEGLVLISIQNEREWADFCTHFLDEPGLPARPGFESNVIRVAHRGEVDAHIGAHFARHTREEAAARLVRANTAFGFVNGVAELSTHPALRRVSVDTPNGSVSLAAPPVVLSDGPRHLGPVPAIGANSAAIRAEFG
jgi:crotonobetainyl-CoA:carnitine CoA-transferase CaiB-like acyl-CoA transferase